MARIILHDVTEISDFSTGDLSTALIDVSEQFVTDSLGGTSLSTGTLANIQRYLTAHYAAVRYPRSRMDKFPDGFAQEWEGRVESDPETIGLLGTQYGQMAVTLDTTQTLRNMSENKQTGSLEFLTEGW